MRRISLWLFVVALSIRLAASTQRILFGVGGIPFFPSASAWGDFDVIYLWQLKMINSGFLPYRDFAYSYPPLFIYALYPFYLWGGAYAASIPIILSDAATVPLIYFLVLEFADKRVAVVAALAYALSPIAIFNEGYLWLSSQPMTFFILLSVYFATQKQNTSSAVALALAILSKQEAIGILPIIAITTIRNSGRMFWRTAGLFLGILFAASLPFLLFSGPQYLSSLTFTLLGAPNAALASPNVSATSITAPPNSCVNVSLNQAFPSVAVCGNVSVNLNQLIYLQFTSKIEILARIIMLPLFFVILPAVITSKTQKGFIQLAGAYTTIGLLLLFSISIHQSLQYYLIPVYALLYAACPSLVAIIAVTAFQLLSLASPNDTIGTTIAIGCVLILLVLRDRPQKKDLDSVVEQF